jgi:hypothetical protein
MSEGLGLQRPAIGVISIAAAFLSAVALNHQSVEDILHIPRIVTVTITRSIASFIMIYSAI